MTRTSIRNNRGAIPTWAKILLGIVLVGIVGIVALSFVLYNTVKDMGTTDPQKIAAMAKDVAVMSDPLPGNFQWKVGMNMKIMQIVSAKAPDGQTITMMTIPTAKKDAGSILHGTGSEKTSTPAQITSVEQKGTETVGGLPMMWEQGTIIKDGKQSKGFMGVVINKPKSNTVLIIGEQETGEYNWPETKKFLAGIQSF